MVCRVPKPLRGGRRPRGVRTPLGPEETPSFLPYEDVHKGVTSRPPGSEVNALPVARREVVHEAGGPHDPPHMDGGRRRPPTPRQLCLQVLVVTSHVRDGRLRLRWVRPPGRGGRGWVGLSQHEEPPSTRDLSLLG